MLEIITGFSPTVLGPPNLQLSSTWALLQSKLDLHIFPAAPKALKSSCKCRYAAAAAAAHVFQSWLCAHLQIHTFAMQCTTCAHSRHASSSVMVSEDIFFNSASPLILPARSVPTLGHLVMNPTVCLSADADGDDARCLKGRREAGGEERGRGGCEKEERKRWGGGSGCSCSCGPGGELPSPGCSAETSMGGCVGSHHDSSGSLNENSDGTGGNLATCFGVFSSFFCTRGFL